MDQGKAKSMKEHGRKSLSADYADLAVCSSKLLCLGCLLNTAFENLRNLRNLRIELFLLHAPLASGASLM
jgi:hypothetical protein